MFTNPLNRKYQTGGKISKQQYAKAFVSWLKTNKDGFKDKSESEIVQAISDMSKSKDGKKATASLRMEFEKNNPEYKGVLDDSKTENAPKKEDTSEEKESKFADGGKMQYFICKHSRGGNVNCGCGGTVVKGRFGIDEIPVARDSTVTTNGVVLYPSNTIKAPDNTLVKVTYGHDKDGQWFRKEEDSNGVRILGGYKHNNKWIPDGDIVYGPGTYVYDDAIKSSNKPQSKQEGGPVLTRRQARELSGLNRGYSRSDFQTAMANADLALRNAGLRGKELRQAKRRMIAGINVEPTPEVEFTDNTVPTVVTQPIQEAVALSELPVRTPVIEKPVHPVVRRKPIVKVKQPVVVETIPVDDGEWIFGTHPEYAPRPGRVQIPERRNWFVSALGDARDAKIGAIGAGQVRDLYAEGRDEEAKKLAKNYTIANAVGIAGAAGTQAAVEGLPYIKAAAEKAAAIKRIPSIEEADVLRRAWNNGAGYVPISGFKCGGKIEKAQEGVTIGPAPNEPLVARKINNFINNNSKAYRISEAFRKFKQSAPGKVLDFFIPDIEHGMVGAVGGPLLKFEGNLIKISEGLTPEQQEKARKLAYEIADRRALRKSLARDLDDAYGMTNGPWSNTFGRQFKLKRTK